MSEAAYFTTKALTALAMPLGIALLCMLAVLAFMRSRRSTVVLIWAAGLVLWTSSAPYVANHLAAYWEAEFPPRNAAGLPSADAIVVLGGGFAVRSKDGALDFNAASDRLFVARELYLAGKSPRIVIAGGNEPFRKGWVSEAEATKRLLETVGVPGSAILTEGASVNTAENARFVRSVLAEVGATRILLVTSAFHMTRALTLFEPTGLEVIPVPTDHRADIRDEFWAGDLLPSADALALTSTILKEALGLFYGRVRGIVSPAEGVQRPA